MSIKYIISKPYSIRGWTGELWGEWGHNFFCLRAPKGYNPALHRNLCYWQKISTIVFSHVPFHFPFPNCYWIFVHVAISQTQDNEHLSWTKLYGYAITIDPPRRQCYSRIYNPS